MPIKTKAKTPKMLLNRDKELHDYNLTLVTWSWDAAYLQDKLYYKYFQSVKLQHWTSKMQFRAVSGLG